MSTLALEPLTGVGVGVLDEGAGDAARGLRAHFGAVVRHFLEPVSSGSSMREGLSALRETIAEATINGEAVNHLSAVHACRFLALLPPSVESPHVGLDPDGEVSIEWISSQHWALSLSFGNDQTITYAARLGIERVRGLEFFDDEIPDRLRGALYDVLSR
jgi:hypothetical protein